MRKLFSGTALANLHLNLQCTSPAKLSVFVGLLVISSSPNIPWKMVNLPSPNTHTYALENWKGPLEVLSPKLDAFSFLKHLVATWEFKLLRVEVCFQLCQPSVRWRCGAEVFAPSHRWAHPPQVEEYSYKATSLRHRRSFDFSGCSHATKPSAAPGEFCWLP